MSQTISSQVQAFCVLANYPVSLNDCLTAVSLSPLNLPHVDVYQTLPDEILKINQVRDIKAFLTTPPLKINSKIVFIPNGDQATIEAQNALLKTLEEPPVNCYIFLILSQLDNLLPTISSRCQTLNLCRPTSLATLTPEKITSIQSFTKQSPALRLLNLDPYNKDRLTALNFLHDCLFYFQSQLHQKLTPSTYKNLNLATEVYSRILKNGQIKLCLGHFALNLHALN